MNVSRRFNGKDHMPATDLGKEHAINKLHERRQMKPLPPNYNASLPAGSPMYFNCHTCNGVLTLPEDYSPCRPRHCEECQALIALGWMEGTDPFSMLL